MPNTCCHSIRTQKTLETWQKSNTDSSSANLPVRRMGQSTTTYTIWTREALLWDSLIALKSSYHALIAIGTRFSQRIGNGCLSLSVYLCNRLCTTNVHLPSHVNLIHTSWGKAFYDRQASIRVSPEGWSDNETGVQWLEDGCDKHTRQRTIGTPCLLILDQPRKPHI